MSLKQTVAPETEPITLQDARDYLRVDLVDDDDLITSLIVAARTRVETIIRRPLITQTWRMKADRFPWYLGNGWYEFGGQNHQRDGMYLPLPPLISVSSVTYLDENGDTQTLSTSDYVVSTDSEPARITLAVDANWPSTQCVADAVTITFTCGYGTSADVPDGIKTAIKMLVSHWYENRVPIVTGTIASDIPMTVDALLDPFRWGSYV